MPRSGTQPDPTIAGGPSRGCTGDTGSAEGAAPELVCPWAVPAFVLTTLG